MKYRLPTATAETVAANEELSVVIDHLNGWLSRGLPQLVSVSIEGGHYCVTLTGALPDAERDHLALVEA